MVFMWFKTKSYFLSVILFNIARIFESWRDAIDFYLGAEPMNFLWHFLKFPHYLLLIMCGLFIKQEELINEGFIYLIKLFFVYMVTGIVTFELFLYLFRNYIYN